MKDENDDFSKTEVSRNSMRLEKWNEMVSDICGSYKTINRDKDKNFNGNIKRYDAMGLKYVTIDTNADTVIKTNINNLNDNRPIFIITQIKGRSIIGNDFSEVQLDQGDIVILDSTYQSASKNSGSVRQLKIIIERDTLERYCEELDIPKLLYVSATSVFGVLLGSFLKQVYAYSGELIEYSTGLLQDSIASLVATIIYNNAKKEEKSNSSKAITILSVKNYIESHAGDGNLSPVTIANHFNCSTRTIYRILSEEETSISRYIMRVRLERCREIINDKNYSHMSITEIAFRWGFADASHFSRCFKRQFGMPPVEFRQMAERGQ